MITKNRKNKDDKRKKSVKKLGKAIARDLALGLVGDFIGPTNAKLGYKFLSKAKKGSASNLVLSKACSDWLSCYTAPMSQKSKMIGIPRPPSHPSFKNMGFIRGVGAIGTTGVGFVAVAPCLNNNNPCLYFTTAAYTDTVTSTPPSDLNLTSSNQGDAHYPAWVPMSNLPYTSSQLTTTTGVTSSGADIAGRIVSCTLSVEYTGTLLNQSGQFYGYFDPDTNNVLGSNHVSTAAGTGLSSASLAQKDSCEIYNINSKRKMHLVMFPTEDTGDDYPRQNASFSRKNFPYSSGEAYTTNTSDTTSAGAAVGVIMITGQAGQTFYFEMCTHAEYIGVAVPQALLSESHNDVVGYDAVKSLLAKAQRRVAGSNQSFSQAVKSEMRKEKIVLGSGIRSK